MRSRSACRPARAAALPSAGVPSALRWTYSMPASANAPLSGVLEKPGRRDSGSARTSITRSTPALSGTAARGQHVIEELRVQGRVDHMRLRTDMLHHVDLAPFGPGGSPLRHQPDRRPRAPRARKLRAHLDEAVAEAFLPLRRDFGRAVLLPTPVGE